MKTSWAMNSRPCAVGAASYAHARPEHFIVRTRGKSTTFQAQPPGAAQWALDGRLPFRPVFPGPEPSHRVVVTDDAPVLRIDVERAAGAEGDVAQVTQKRALVPVLDVRIGPAALAGGVDEIAHVV